MEDLRFAGSPLSDLSANLFATLLLVLLILLHGLGAARPSPPPRTAVEAVRDLGAIDRAPPGAAAIVDALRRRGLPDGLALDVHEDRVERAAGPGRPAAGLTLPLRADALPVGEGPVRLYVFAHGTYTPVVTALQARGVSWTEVSVPTALRREDGAGWSQGFLDLLPRAGDLAAFRTGLARLLEGGTERGGAAGGRGTGGAAATAAAPEEAPMTRWLRVIGAALGLLATLAGLLFVLAVETLARRRMRTEPAKP